MLPRIARSFSGHSGHHDDKYKKKGDPFYDMLESQILTVKLKVDATGHWPGHLGRDHQSAATQYKKCTAGDAHLLITSPVMSLQPAKK